MARDYYIILGVGSDATQDQIKSAYRQKAKQWHPDCYEGGCEPFLDVQEAYEVLSDPTRRRAYDDSLVRQRPVHTQTEPLRSTRCPVEPLIPTEPPVGFGEPRDDRFFESPFDPFYGRLWEDLDQPRSQELDQIVVDVALTREQALQGGRVRVWLPVQTRCPTCWGQGSVGLFGCWHCSGRGAVIDEYPVSVAYPAGILDRAVAELPLDRLGLPDACLLVRFHVSQR